jgi:NAD(P)-dependent dehydrogenase (short-subunit alcohol dehydrogenase family)
MSEQATASPRFSFDLTGRTILVTGASSGIGNHFARLLAASGANVVMGARRLSLLKDLKSQIEATGGKGIAVEMDVADEQSTIAAYDAAEKAFGGVDSVIANAGVNPTGSALRMPVEDLDQLLSINLRGVFLTAREGARRMIKAGSVERGHGRIVIISSITAQHVYPGLAIYSATKAAVLQMGKVLAADWARKGINVNVICPGYMPSAMTSDFFETPGGQHVMAGFARPRIMGVEALDAMLLFLSSDASAQTTGSVFTVDDGQTLGS